MRPPTRVEMAPEPSPPTAPDRVRVLFCGDRAVSVDIVRFMLANGGTIVGLGLNSSPSFHTPKVRLAAGVEGGRVFYGRSFGSEAALRKLGAEAPDIGVSCGFAGILSPAMLSLPRWGWVNMHRSYLPYNRGLDPMQWALVDRTPAGVTMHVMTEEIDAGPIIAQAEMPIFPTDDGDALEERSDRIVLELFQSSWSRLRAGDVAGTPQDESLASYHNLADCDRLRRLDLGATMRVGRVLDILRGYSGRGWSSVEVQVGLIRPSYSVHTQIRKINQPADGPGPRGDVSPTAADGE